MIKDRLKGVVLGGAIPRSQREPASATLDEIRRAVAREFGVAAATLSRDRGGEEKMVAIYVARKHSGRTGVEIGKAFGVGTARISNVVAEIDGGHRPRLAWHLRPVALALT